VSSATVAAIQVGHWAHEPQGASAAPELVLPEYAYLNKRMLDASLALTTVSK